MKYIDAKQNYKMSVQAYLDFCVSQGKVLDFSDAVLFQEKLTGVFESVSFSDAVLTRCDISQATFIDCTFRKAQFISCNMKNAVFKHCQMNYVDFRYIDFYDVTLSGTNMLGIVLNKCKNIVHVQNVLPHVVTFINTSEGVKVNDHYYFGSVDQWLNEIVVATDGGIAQRAYSLAQEVFHKGNRKFSYEKPLTLYTK